MAPNGKTLSERMASVESWIEAHERRFQECQEATLDAIRELKDVVKGWRKAAWGLTLALLAWAMVQVWTTNQRAIEAAAEAAQSVAESR